MEVRLLLPQPNLVKVQSSKSKSRKANVKNFRLSDNLGGAGGILTQPVPVLETGA